MNLDTGPLFLQLVFSRDEIKSIIRALELRKSVLQTVEIVQPIVNYNQYLIEKLQGALIEPQKSKKNKTRIKLQAK